MRAGTNTWHTVGTQLMFVRRDPAASSGLGPWRPDELRVDYQIIRLLTKTVSAPKSPGGRRKGRVSPGPRLRPKRGPKDLFVGCAFISLLSFAPMCHCGDDSTASPPMAA